MRPFQRLVLATCLHSFPFSVSNRGKKLATLKLAMPLAALLLLAASPRSYAQDTQSVDQPAVVQTTPVLQTSIKRPSSAPPNSDQRPGPTLWRTMAQPDLSPVNTGPGIVYTCDPGVSAATCNYLNTTVAGHYNDTFTNANANIYVQYGTTGLASTNQYLNFVTYSQYVTALSGIPNKSAIQVSAQSALSTYDATPYGSDDVEITTALGAALGFTGMTGTTSGGSACTPGTAGCYNAVITVTNDPGTPLYYDNLGGTEPSNAYDFYATVEHETDEVLGTASCVTTQTTPLSDPCGPDTGETGTPSAVDLFRYSSAGNLVLDSSLSTTAGAYFSYNGGTTNGAIGVGASPKYYNTLDNGDDYADYVSSSPDCGTNQAVQDAEGCPGEDMGLTILNDGGSEITILTAVGYQVPSNPSLSVTKSHTGNFTQGSTGIWSIAVNNTGSSATTGTINVSDTLPTNYTLASYTSTGSAWSCSGTGSATVACTSSTAITGGSSSTINLTVNVPATSLTSVSNTALAWGGGDSVHTSSGTAVSSNTDNAIVAQVPASIAIIGNQTQSAAPGTAFGSLAVTVEDAGGVAIPNYTPVVFTAPSTGPSGTFSNTTNTISVPANGSGMANPGTFTANGTGGGPYSVTVTAGAASTFFSLTNAATTTPTFNWTPATTIIFGSAGTTNVLNATVSCGSTCGTITYTATQGVGSPTSITSTSALAAGAYTITANFMPSPSFPQYTANSATSPLTVTGESVWIVDGAGGTSELAANGYGITSSADSGANLVVAIDHAGNVWSAGSGPLLKETSQIGTPQNTITTGGGLNAPTAIAIDGASQVWVANANNSVSLFANSGTALSPSAGIADPSLSTPAGIAIDLAGSVWITNNATSTLTRFLGAAIPVAPIATSVANNTTGAKP